MVLELAGIHMMMPTPFDANGKLDETFLAPLVNLAAETG